MSALTELDDFNFHHVLGDRPGASLVLFVSEGCAACRSWKRLLTEALPDRHGLNLFVVDAGHNPGLVNEFEVFHLPALFLYLDGHYHASVQCEARPAALLDEIGRLRQEPAGEAP